MNIINSNINTININNINSTTSLTDINDILNSALNQKIKILDNHWELAYKDRCPQYYMSLSEVISEIELLAIDFHDDNSHLKINAFLNDDYHATLSFLDIPNILRLCKEYNFKEIKYSGKFRNMICEACACKDCPCLEEYFNCTCAECKKDFYRMYAGYCGECDN